MAQYGHPQYGADPWGATSASHGAAWSFCSNGAVALTVEIFIFCSLISAIAEPCLCSEINSYMYILQAPMQQPVHMGGGGPDPSFGGG